MCKDRESRHLQGSLSLAVDFSILHDMKCMHRMQSFKLSHANGIFAIDAYCYIMHGTVVDELNE